MNAEKMVTHYYYLLVGLMMKERVDQVVSALVKRGYFVGPLSSDSKVYSTCDDNVCTILHLQLTKKLPSSVTNPREIVFDDIKRVLSVTDTKYYMMWLGEPTSCNWSVGNIVVTRNEPLGPYRTNSLN